MSEPSWTKHEQYRRMVGHRIREIYCAAKQAQEPRWKLQPRQDRPVIWEKAAETCLELGMDPNDYVAMFFHAYSGLVVYPNTLASPESAKRLLLERRGKSAATFVDSNATDLLIEDMVANLRQAFSDAVRLVCVGNNGQFRIRDREVQQLMQPCYNIDPIVLYCLCYPHPIVDGIHGNEVRRRYATSPVLQQALNRLEVDPVIFAAAAPRS